MAGERGCPPGIIKNYRCACGATVRATGGSHKTRCEPCKKSAIDLRSGGRYAARAKVAAAIKSGELPPLDGLVCVDCAAPAIEYEHRDYARPLDVQPICRRCNLLRGPAAPVPGSFEAAVASGIVPLRRTSSVVKLLRGMGRDGGALAHYPATLTLDHWRAILPLVARADHA